MRKEMPLVSFSVESDRQKHGKEYGETHIFLWFSHLSVVLPDPSLTLWLFGP